MQSKARILIVDDRIQNLAVLETLLAPLGHPIDRAHSGTDALRLLLKHDYAVILLDVQLPDIDGFETASVIKQRQKTRDIPIIFITAISTDPRNVFKGYSSGAVDYIAKPFNPDILKAKVSIFIDLHLKGERIKEQAEELRQSALRDADARRVEREREIDRMHYEQLSAAYAREKRIAEVLQRSLLLTPPETAFHGLTLATLYEAAWDEASLGGDFFDVFRLTPSRIALIVGDVAGKGLQAAARTAEVKYSLRAFMRECHHPGDALCRVNRTMLGCSPAELSEFVCVSVVVWDIDTHLVQAVSAGGESPFILRCGGSVESLDVSGLPVGIDVVDEYEASVTTIEPGDHLVIVTDGITEARCGGRLFGREGVTDCGKAEVDTTAMRTASTILAEAKKFAGGRLNDDACILVARCEQQLRLGE